MVCSTSKLCRRQFFYLMSQSDLDEFMLYKFIYKFILFNINLWMHNFLSGIFFHWNDNAASRARTHECCGLHFMRWGVMPAQTQLTLVIFLWVWLIINSKKNPSFFYFIISIKVFWNILGLGNLKCWSCESFVNWFTIMSDFSLIFGVLWSTSNFGFNFITVKGDGGNGFFPLLLGSMIQR
jgi:hypothetical protein